MRGSSKGATKVLIAGDLFGFPHGLAATNFVRLLAGGVRDAGLEVGVLVTRCSEAAGVEPLNTEPKGLADGIPFEYATGTPIDPLPGPGRKWSKIRGAATVVFRLMALKRSGGRAAVLLYTQNHATQRWVVGWAHRIGLPVFLLLAEWPEACSSQPPTVARLQQEFCKQAFDDVDGAVVISEYLENVCRDEGARQGRTIPCLRVPVLVDPTEWEPAAPSPPPPARYVLYCASFDDYLDDALFVIDSVGSAGDSDCHLVMVGRASAETEGRVLAAAGRAGLADRLRLVGYVPEDELRRLFKDAILLLAPTHNDTRSLARFPSKVAGYMMSGRPVVASAFGEVGRYLVDGETAFLCSEDDAKAFGGKIREVLADADRANRVGRAGRLAAAELFDSRAHGIRVAAFVEGVLDGGGAR